MNRLFNPDEIEEPGCFIGMDEAGYGPNLGPLVIAATSWETPGLPEKCDFTALLQDVVDVQSTCRKSKLHIADSKLVNKGKYGFESLETSALSLLRAAGIKASTFRGLREYLCSDSKTFNDPLKTIPWFEDDIRLPVMAEPPMVNALSNQFKQTLHRKQFGLLKLQAAIVPATQFNTLLDETGSKGIVLTTLAFQLLNRIWNQQSKDLTLFVGDKHGGRNRYSDYLASITESEIKIVEEARAISRYQSANTEFRFQTKGEQHLPVAAASIIAKYIRELAMIQFNSYWKQFCPEIKPTKGYPVDAKRFWEAIQSAQKDQQMSDDLLWRKR